MMNFLDYLETGSHSGPFMDGAIGPSFMTPHQHWFRSMRGKYGEGNLDDGNYYLSQIHFDKETGTASLGQMDVGPSGWYGTPPNSYKSCDCKQDPHCCG